MIFEQFPLDEVHDAHRLRYASIIPSRLPVNQRVITPRDALTRPADEPIRTRPVMTGDAGERRFHLAARPRQFERK